MTLSVVVPILNEIAQLSGLFSSLSDQTGCEFELVLVDGGSSDGTLGMAKKLASSVSFPCRITSSRRGRGRQLNRGAALGTGRTLLFLHADSRFAEAGALALALDCLDRRIAEAGHERFAGRFGLRFDRQGSAHSFGFYYLECKALLDRPGCIHGDQGYLMRRDFFAQVGPFEESLGFHEDNRLARAVRQKGTWLLLPAVLITSSRRFCEEGFRPRQELNALIMTFEGVGRDDLLSLFPDIYRQQSRTQHLRLKPFYKKLSIWLATLSRLECWRFWCRVGRYLVANAWQLAFFGDVRRAFRRRLAPGCGARTTLEFFDRYFLILIDHPFGHAVAALFAWIWFRARLISR